MSTIGSRIKQIRLKINLSQEDFANFFGTGKSYVSDMFNAPKYEEVESDMEAKVMAILKKQGVIE